jgi:hypothetical protein
VALAVLAVGLHLCRIRFARARPSAGHDHTTHDHGTGTPTTTVTTDGVTTASGVPAQGIAWLEDTPVTVSALGYVFGAWFDASVAAGAHPDDHLVPPHRPPGRGRGRDLERDAAGRSVPGRTRSAGRRGRAGGTGGGQAAPGRTVGTGWEGTGRGADAMIGAHPPAVGPWNQPADLMKWTQ